jgi:hypothetical protein
MTKSTKLSALDKSKKQFLVYLEPGLAKEIQIAAVEDGVAQSSVTAEALREWLSKRAETRQASLTTSGSGQ